MRVNMQSGKHLCLVGLGNIGSHIVPHLARMPGVGRVTLIDRDVYETHNLVGQDIAAADVGEAKALVQSRRIERVNPELSVEAIVDSVENVPLGALRCDVILAGLDSRRARQTVNERAWYLGIPWVDGGVETDGLLARTTVYIPGQNQGCLECDWNSSDYEAIEQRYPCGSGSADARATHAPSSLGALAASLVSIEAGLLLSGARDPDVGGHSMLLDAKHHQYYPTRLVFNPKCLMPGHLASPAAVVEECPGDATLGEILANAQHLRVLGQSFITALTCPHCGCRREELRLQASFGTAPAMTCDRCGDEMVSTGFDMTDELESTTLPVRFLASSLRDLGIRHGDVFRVSGPDGVTRNLEVTDGRHPSTERATEREEERSKQR